MAKTREPIEHEKVQGAMITLDAILSDLLSFKPLIEAVEIGDSTAISADRLFLRAYELELDLMADTGCDNSSNLHLLKVGTTLLGDSECPIDKVVLSMALMNVIQIVQLKAHLTAREDRIVRETMIAISHQDLHMIEALMIKLTKRKKDV